MLRELYGIDDATVTPIAHGHTNASFLVVTPSAHYVLRRAWAGKSASQIAAEAHVLSHLAAPCDVPRIVPTLLGANHAVFDGRVHHLFRIARGEPGPRYLVAGDAAVTPHGAVSASEQVAVQTVRVDGEARMRAAMGRLAELHRALAAVPAGVGESWLRARLARVRGRGLEALQWPFGIAATPGALRAVDARPSPARAGLRELEESLLARIEQLLPTCRAPQWLHGDYHLGNLLWSAGEVTGIVDFDDVAHGSAALEAGMALFALARQPVEERFVFDPALVEAGRAAYAGPIEGDAFVFCAYQVLVHLEAAQRGLWPLTEGIGFWPCWNTLSRA